jgi:hypothetical protein
MISHLAAMAATLLVAVSASVGSSLPACAAGQETAAVLFVAEDPTSPAMTPAPDGWVTRSFGAVRLAAPPSWTPVMLDGRKVNTEADLSDELRKVYLENLQQPNVLGALIDTGTLSNTILESFVTEMLVAAQPNESGQVDPEQLATFAREKIYVGPDAPKDVAVTVFSHPTAPAIQARYTYEQDGSKGLAIEYTIAFPNHLVFLGLSTDERNPEPDIAKGEQIARTAAVI